MYAFPHTPLGRRALWLLLPVLIYILTPVYLLVDLLVPASWRAVTLSPSVRRSADTRSGPWNARRRDRPGGDEGGSA